MTEPGLFDNGHKWVRNLLLALAGLAVTGIFTGVWSASDAWTRIGTLEKQVQVTAPLAERMARLEGKFDDLKDAVTELTRTIRSTPERR